MTNRDPDQSYRRAESAIPFFVDQAIKGVCTGAPGIIESYNPNTKRAVVQPALNRMVGSLEDAAPIRKPLISDVPVIHPSGGGYIVHIPLRKGDPVWLQFSERGIERFKETFEVSDPPLDSFYAERDAVAFPGFGALNITPAGTGLTMQTEDGVTFVELKPGSVRIEAANVHIESETTVIVSSQGTATFP